MIQGEWKSDGLDTEGKATWIANKNESESEESDASSISINTTPGGSPMNLCYFLASPQPVYFNLVEFMEASSRSVSLSVGVVRPSEFKKGWGARGLFYNGNLTNGSAALKVGYGPYLKQGDTVMVEYREAANKFQVKFHVNGACLGTAFEIPKDSSSSNESFLPCLHVQGTLKVRTRLLSEPPPNPTAVQEGHPLHGKWTLIKAYDDSTEARTQIWPIGTEDEGDGTTGHGTITLDLEPPSDSDTSDPWIMVLKICNTFRIIKNISDGGQANEYCLTVPPGAASRATSTMMMPPPLLDEIEGKLSVALGSDWKKIELADGGRLRALASDNTILADFKRQQRDVTAVACTSYA